MADLIYANRKYNKMYKLQANDSDIQYNAYA